MLRDAGIESVGLDRADEAVQASRSHGFNIEQAECFPFLESTSQKFGGIFCSQVIEHMDFESTTRLIELCRRVLRPGGKLVIVTPNPEDLAIIGENILAGSDARSTLSRDASLQHAGKLWIHRDPTRTVQWRLAIHWPPPSFCLLVEEDFLG